MLISEALQRYERQLQADGRSVHTINQARRHVRLLDVWLGEAHDVETITHEDLARFLTSDVVLHRADGEARKPTSANALRSSIRTFLGFVNAAGYSTSNPGRLIRRAVCGTPLPKALTDDEQERLLATLADAVTEAERRDRVLFELMLKTGIRIGSALGIRVEDVDLQRGEIVLLNMKYRREHRVYLPESLAGLIAEWIKSNAEGFLFPGNADTSLTPRHVSRRLASWCSKAGIAAFSPHALRHSFATGLYQRTGDIRLVQQALAHASIASTTRYAAVGTDRLRAAVASPI
jgi:site-specific recombinase XerD